MPNRLTLPCRRPRGVLPLVGLLLAGGCALASAGTRYRITELPLPDGLPVAVGLSPQGVVAGTLHPPLNAAKQVFRWSAGAGLAWAPSEDPKWNQYALNLDDAGTVVFSTASCCGPLPRWLHTAAWWASGKLRTRPPQTVFFGNGAGDLVVSGQSTVYALRTRGADPIEIDMPVRTELFAVNRQGVVVGQLPQPGGRAQAVAWSAPQGWRPLPVLPDEDQVAAVALNDAGQVALVTGPTALQQDDPDNAPNLAYLWHPQAGLQPLGTLSDCAWYRPLKVNAAGTAVGYCHARPTPTSTQHAWVWQPGAGLSRLADDIDPADPLAGAFTLQRAVGLNDAGQVLVEARDADLAPRLLLLSPLTE